VLDPEVARRAAVGMALDDVGLAAANDEQCVTLFLDALKEHGYVVIHEFNGVHPDQRKE
jgi:hypothetical protein